MGYMLGIDLGTTNSAMAVLEGNDPSIIANSDGARTTPSVIAFSKKNPGDIIVGAIARRQQAVNHDRTVASAKRHMGTDWTVDIDGKQYTPEEIASEVLKKMKKDAEDYLGGEVTSAVITVPAYFDDNQRQATKRAGKLAGLEVERIINEPTAAALAYGIDKEQDQLILVYDLGGGTFDVSLLEIGEGMIEVRATAGDNKLGGDDWDAAIIDWVSEKVKADHGFDVASDPSAQQRVKEAAEEAKKELSNSESTTISLAYLGMGTDGQPFSAEYDLTRGEFEELTSDLLERTREPIERVLSDAGVEVGDVNHVLLVGGSTRMAAIADMVKEMAGKEPSKTVNPDEVVAMGACYQAGITEGKVKDMILIDVTSLTLGLDSRGGIMVPLIRRGTAMPCRSTETFTTAEDGQTSVQVKVYQGEREMNSGNKKLGEFDLTGIPPAPQGVPQIEVTFDIDVNGILDVSARDKASGVEQRVTVSGQSSGLDDMEVNRAIQEAEEHAEDDKQARENATTRNRVTSLIGQNKRMIEDYKDRVSDADAEPLKKAIEEAEEASQGTDYDTMKAKGDALFAESQKFGAKLYG